MFRIFSIAFVLFATLFTAAASAYDPYVAVRPQQGTYWNPTASGAGYQIDIMPSGLVFAGVYVYDDEGTPIWYTFSGQFEPSTTQNFAETGIIGRATSFLYRSDGGGCLGCPPTPNMTEVVTEYGQTDLTWYGTGRVEFRWAGGSTMLTRTAEAIAGNTTAELTRGTWRATRVTFTRPCSTCEPTNFKETFDGYYEITDRPTTSNLKFYIPTLSGQGTNIDGVPLGQEYQGDPAVTLPTNERQFNAHCTTPGTTSATLCQLFKRTVQAVNESNKILYLDSATGGLRALGYCGLSNTTGCGRSSPQVEVAPTSAKYEFLMVAPDKIVVRLVLGYRVTGNKFGDIEYVLTKVNAPPADLSK